MKRTVITLSALAFLLAGACALSPTFARADEDKDPKKTQEAYNPEPAQIDEDEIGEDKSVSKAMRTKRMKAKARQIRRGNQSGASGYGAAHCSSAYCR